MQLGPDRRQALTKLPGAVASLQARIAVADRSASGDTPTVARYPMTAQEIAIANYRSLISFDLEIREHDPRFADLEIDPKLLAGLRAGMAGRLDDDQLEELVGHRIERFRYRGNTDVAKGTLEWRKLARNLCVSEYEAMARAAERDDGDLAAFRNIRLSRMRSRGSISASLTSWRRRRTALYSTMERRAARSRVPAPHQAVSVNGFKALGSSPQVFNRSERLDQRATRMSASRNSAP